MKRLDEGLGAVFPGWRPPSGSNPEISRRLESSVMAPERWLRNDSLGVVHPHDGHTAYDCDSALGYLGWVVLHYLENLRFSSVTG